MKDNKFFVFRKDGKFALIVFILFLLIVVYVFDKVVRVDGPFPSSGCDGFSGIRPVNWGLLPDGIFYMTLTNVGETKVSISRESVDVALFHVQCEKTPVDDIDMVPGEVRQIKVRCDGLKMDVDDYYKADIGITYLRPPSEAAYQSKGFCWGRVEQTADGVYAD